MFNFPSAPAQGQVYGEPGAIAYQWNGYAWVPAPPTVQAPAPARLLQVVLGTALASVVVPPEKESANASVIVKSATSQLIVQAGSNVYLVNGYASATLKLMADATVIVASSVTNDHDMVGFSSLTTSGAHVHGLPIGSTVLIRSLVTFGGAASTCYDNWMLVQEVEP